MDADKELDFVDVRDIVKMGIAFEEHYRNFYLRMDTETLTTGERSKFAEEKFDCFLSKSHLLQARKVIFLGLRTILTREGVIIRSGTSLDEYQDVGFI